MIAGTTVPAVAVPAGQFWPLAAALGACLGSALIVQQAHELGWKGPIVGSDSWGSAETVKLCGKDWYGLFFSTHYAAAGAMGATKQFIDNYKAKDKYEQDDVSALTWDATRLLLQPGHSEYKGSDRRFKKR